MQHNPELFKFKHYHYHFCVTIEMHVLDHSHMSHVVTYRSISVFLLWDETGVPGANPPVRPSNQKPSTVPAPSDRTQIAEVTSQSFNLCANVTAFRQMDSYRFLPVFLYMIFFRAVFSAFISSVSFLNVFMVKQCMCTCLGQ